MTLYQSLLGIHILAGTCALLAAVAAVGSKTANAPHHIHAYSGRVFFVGMIVIFITAFCMAILKPNLFLFLIALFSFYLALAGWRYGRNRSGKPEMQDWARVAVILPITAGMIGIGFWRWWSGDSTGIALCGFGIIGLVNGLLDWKSLRAGITGKQRIARHLTLMLGASIATVTAVVVVNFTFSPMWMLWLAPTAVILPVIIWWNRQVRAGKGLRP